MWCSHFAISVTSSEYKECLQEQKKVTHCLGDCQKEYARVNEDMKALNTQVRTSHAVFYSHVCFPFIPALR